MNEITNILESGEKVEWEGKPKKSVYLFDLFFGTTLVIGIVSLFVYFSSNRDLIYFAPLLWVIGIVLGLIRYRVTHYAITNKRIILQKGIIGRDFKSIDYDKVQDVSVNVGLIDKMFGTGKIIISNGSVIVDSRNNSLATSSLLNSIESPYELLKTIQTHLSKRKESLYSGK